MLFRKEYITDSLMPRIRDLWHSSQNTVPVFLPNISHTEKKTNEKWITENMERIRLQLKSFSPRQKIHMSNMENLLRTLLLTEPVLGICNVLPAHTLDAFMDKMKLFLRQVRSFAPDMKPEDMGQAIRNYMVYAIFREQNGLSQECPPSIFGYSMLYPFTDNFLDDPAHTAEEKKHYNQLIHHKINGQTVTPLSLHEERTSMLLDAIAKVYPGPQANAAYGWDASADIRQGLLLMLEAQEISQKQTDAALPLSHRNILDISIYKGGLSVLIDRYLINYKITDEDILFYFGFGFLLQLCDDLQDIAQDRENGSRTLLTCCSNREKTEAMVNQLFHYTSQLFRFSPDTRPVFREFLLQNCYRLILSSAAGSASFFHTDYLDALEHAFPVSFSYLNQIKEKLPASFTAGREENQHRMMSILDAFLNVEDKLI